MTSRFRIACAATAVAAVSLAAAAPAGAQEAPTLGFEIDRTEGAPGDQVNGVVDIADVAEHCPANVEELQADFAALGATLQSIQTEFEIPPDAQFIPREALTFQILSILANVISTDTAPDGPASTTYDQTFVMTFADIATQAPVGERANYDPAVGEATVTVPDVAPGLWAVAATCVAPASDIDSVRAAISAGTDYLTEALQLPDPIPVDWEGPPDFDILTWLMAEGGPALLEPLMAPTALGYQIFCVVDADGICPADAGPPGDPTDPTAPVLPAAPPAQPVIAVPTFTG